MNTQVHTNGLTEKQTQGLSEEEIIEGFSGVSKSPEVKTPPNVNVMSKEQKVLIDAFSGGKSNRSDTKKRRGATKKRRGATKKRPIKKANKSKRRGATKKRRGPGKK